MKKKSTKKMKEDIRLMKSSSELNKNQTTEVWVKIMEMHKI